MMSMELMAAVGRELAQHAGRPSFPTGHASPLTAQITSLPPKAEPSCGVVTAVSAHVPAAVVPQHSREQQGPRWVLGPPVPPPQWADAEEEIEHPYSLFRHELDGLRKILALGAARLQLGTRTPETDTEVRLAIAYLRCHDAKPATLAKMRFPQMAALLLHHPDYNIRSQAAKLLSAEDMMKEAVRLVKRASRAEAWLFAGLPGSSDGEDSGSRGTALAKKASPGSKKGPKLSAKQQRARGRSMAPMQAADPRRPHPHPAYQQQGYGEACGPAVVQAGAASTSAGHKYGPTMALSQQRDPRRHPVYAQQQQQQQWGQAQPPLLPPGSHPKRKRSQQATRAAKRAYVPSPLGQPCAGRQPQPVPAACEPFSSVRVPGVVPKPIPPVVHDAGKPRNGHMCSTWSLDSRPAPVLAPADAPLAAPALAPAAAAVPTLAPEAAAPPGPDHESITAGPGSAAVQGGSGVGPSPDSSMLQQLHLHLQQVNAWPGLAAAHASAARAAQLPHAAADPVPVAAAEPVQCSGGTATPPQLQGLPECVLLCDAQQRWSPEARAEAPTGQVLEPQRSSSEPAYLGSPAPVASAVQAAQLRRTRSMPLQ